MRTDHESLDADFPYLKSDIYSKGYNNDTYFYQRPNQPLWSPANVSYLDGQVGVEEVGVLNGGQKRDDEQDEKLPKMRTGLFLVLHTFVNVFLLLSCTGESHYINIIV